MTIQIACQPTLEQKDRYDLLVLPFWEGAKAAAEFSSFKEILDKPLASGDFKAKLGDTLLLYGQGRILALGLGKEELLSAEGLRRAYSAAVRLASLKKIKTIHLLAPASSKLSLQETLRGVSEGTFLTNYAFTHLKGDSLKDNPPALLEKAVFVGVKDSEMQQLHKWRTLSQGVHFVRELVNGNADEVTPEMLAQTVHSLGKRWPHLKAHVLERKHLEKEKMGLLLAVNRGSSCEPYLLSLSYRGNRDSDEHIVLIGKGITYDTGGHTLKQPDNMMTQKSDMSGAATVLAAVETAAALGLKVNVTALAPVTENSIDAKSFKLGDVYRSMSGKTVEITNTDAEGRLVLADAITYAIKHLQPTQIIDIATLTGGIVIALGEEIAGLFSNDDALAEDLKRSSETTGELLWRMPLHFEYKEMLKSEIADLVNAAGRSASSILAALFIQEFCQGIPWAHIDFAGTSYLTKPRHYHTSRASGYGLRLLIDYLEKRSSP